jgi:hypothetical protein
MLNLPGSLAVQSRACASEPAIWRMLVQADRLFAAVFDSSADETASSTRSSQINSSSLRDSAGISSKSFRFQCSLAPPVHYCKEKRVTGLPAAWTAYSRGRGIAAHLGNRDRAQPKDPRRLADPWEVCSTYCGTFRPADIVCDVPYGRANACVRNDSRVRTNATLGQGVSRLYSPIA